MVAFEEPTHRSRAVIPVVLVLLGANAAFGYGYLHYHGIAAEQETAIKRVESANADLQDALGHMRDRTQRSVQQLSLDNRELLTRLSKEAMDSPWDAEVRLRLAEVCEQMGRSDLAEMWRRAAQACSAAPLTVE